MAKQVIGFLFLAFIVFPVSAADNGYRAEIYSAYIGNDMAKWKVVLDRMDSQNLKPDLYLLELVNYQYGYIALCIANNKEDEARKYLEKAETILEILKKDIRNQSNIAAYKSAFYAFRIGLNKLSAPFLGPKSLESARESVSLDPHNFLGYVQYGNIHFYMPSAFGGSKTVALENYIKALELLEENKEDTVLNWNYLSLLATIAQAYSYVGDLDSSKRYLDKVLAVEPGFLWVKNELYPSIIKKMEEERSGQSISL